MPATRQPVSQQIEARYQDGVLRPLTPLDLPEGTLVALTVSAQGDQATDSVAQSAVVPEGRVARRVLLVAGLGLLFYLSTRLVGLEAYPIYFFSDEAIQSVLARDLLDAGLRDNTGTFLPPFFRNADRWNLSLSIYVHAVSVALFGVSIFVNRATSVVVSMLAVLAVMLMLRMFFHSRLWWAGGLVLAALPAWFTHSRTAFETVMMVALYACFLCCYLLYRSRSPRYLPLAVLFGAATFYSYTNGQGVMLVSAGLLAIIDLRYHLRHRRMLLATLPLLFLLALPLLRFFQLQPDAISDQLRIVDSVWTRDLPLLEKLAIFFGNYLTGLSPAYWFWPNEIDFARHRMPGIAHIPTFFLPFALLGLLICLRRIDSPAHRVVLVALLAAPFTAAFSGIFVTRTLALLIPLTLLIVLGLDQAMAWLAKRLPRLPIAPAVALLLVLLNLGTLRAALVDGPTWFADYGLHGMQWGTRELFDVIPPLLATTPSTHIVISPNWSNNADIFLRFFLKEPERSRVRFGTIDPYANYRETIDPNLIFVMPPDEYQRTINDPKFVVAPPELIIPYPDGRPGFHFVRVAYSAAADAIFAAELAERSRLREGMVPYRGQLLILRHSLLDGGMLPDLFDGDPYTLIRGFEANPLVLEFDFPEPQQLTALDLTLATMDFRVTAVLTATDGTRRSYEREFIGLGPDPTVTLDLPDAPAAIGLLRIEITDLQAGDRTHIHVRELAFR
ncbi:MAG TPA: DUF104 domain-containing protein [Roseiflexaceae bacterium]|nr:DUF104 domain-containing protein [Roseiflexaceae bacterium]